MKDATDCSDCHSNRISHLRQGRRLEYFTIGWNMVEAGVAVGAGWLAGSIALVGFGAIHSLKVFPVPFCFGGWLLPLTTKAGSKSPLNWWGSAFLILAAYVAFDALKSLLTYEPPDTSPVGIGLSIVSLILMPILARAKRRSAADLNSRAMKADSRQTDLCAYLSAILLGGLVLNALLGWWWADPVAALIMVPIIAREGFEGLRGEVCNDCH